MIAVDREPILRDWRLKYRELERELVELAKRTEDYHFRAVPEFQSWVARTFGEALSEIREMEERIREAEFIALATEAEAAASGSTEAEAYRMVLFRKERGEDLFPSDESAVEDDWESGWEEVDPERDYREEQRSGGRRDRDSDDASTSRGRGRNRRESADDASRDFFRAREAEARLAESSQDSARLKTLYRKLAFALHPDVNPDLGARERKIWAEVQEAYDERDLERLVLLHSWLESGSEDWLERMTHVGTLRGLVLQKATEVRASRVGFNRLRKEAPWRYWVARDLPEKIELVRLDIEDEFVRAYLSLKKRLERFELHFRRLAGKSPRRPR